MTANGDRQRTRRWQKAWDAEADRTYVLGLARPSRATDQAALAKAAGHAR